MPAADLRGVRRPARLLGEGKPTGAWRASTVRENSGKPNADADVRSAFSVRLSSGTIVPSAPAPRCDSGGSSMTATTVSAIQPITIGQRSATTLAA